MKSTTHALALLAASALGAGCLPTAWRRADAGSSAEAGATSDGGDAASDASVDAALDAPNDGPNDAQAPSDEPASDATEGGAVVVDASLDVLVDVVTAADAAPDAPVPADAFDATPDVVVALDALDVVDASPDAPRDAGPEASVDAAADAFVGPPPALRFLRSSGLCLPRGAEQAVDLALERRGDPRAFAVNVRSDDGLTLSSARATFAPGVSLVTLSLRDPMARTAGSFRLSASYEGSATVDASASGVFAPSTAGALDCSMGVDGFALVAGSGPGAPAQVEASSFAFAGAGASSALVVFGWAYGARGPGWLGGESRWALHRVTSGGAIDTGFGVSGLVTLESGLSDNPELAASVVADPATGAIYAAGYGRRGAVAPNRNAELALARFSANGAVDAAFVRPAGAPVRFFANFSGADVNDALHSIALAPDGTVYGTGIVEELAGSTRRTRATLVRARSDGAQLGLRTASGVEEAGAAPLALGVDETSATQVVFDRAGKLLLVGMTERRGDIFRRAFVARFDLETGALDPSFGAAGVAVPMLPGTSELPAGSVARAEGIAELPDGSLVLAGEIDSGSLVRPALVRLSAAGMLQAWPGTATPVLFAPCPGPGSTGYFHSVAVGGSPVRIVAAGSCGEQRWRVENPAQDTLIFVANLNGGVVDTFFAGGAYIDNLAARRGPGLRYDEARAVRFDHEGRIVALITALDPANQYFSGLLRFLPP